MGNILGFFAADCFNSYYIDQGTVVYQYSDNLIIFMNKHRDLSECFSKYGIQMVSNQGMHVYLPSESTLDETVLQVELSYFYCSRDQTNSTR